MTGQCSMNQMKLALVWSFEILRAKLWLPCLKKIKKPPSVMALELLAPRRAAILVSILVSEIGFQQSCFKGDSEVVVKSLGG